MAIDTTLRWINFRVSAAYVTDGSNQSYFGNDGGTDGELYGNANNQHVSIGGTTYNCGWVKGGSLSTMELRNRTTSGDVRLAGCHYVDQTGGSRWADFRLDLDAAGTYDIHVALGDSYARTKVYAAVYDNTSLLATIVDSSGGTASDHFFDAGGNDRTRAAWPGSEVAVQVTTTSTILNIRLGKTGNTTGQTNIASLGIKLISSSSTDPGIITGSATTFGLPGLILS